MARQWRAPRVRIVEDGNGRPQPIPDFASLFGGVPVLGKRAVEGLADALGANGELLPLRCDETAFWAFNVLSIVDILDAERSSGDWFAPGRLMTLERLVARSPAPKDLPPIFKLPEKLKGGVLITQDFVDAATGLGLRGLDPQPLGRV
jgi:hypothetical protein